jgi:protein-S-isoprenylcysteine O-methyltransferase Ste14
MPMTPANRGPRIWLPPPIVFVAAYLLAWVLNGRLEFLIDGAGAGTMQVAIGSALFVAALAAMAFSVAVFARARTAVAPIRPARQLVTWGPYGLSRNPMYVGLTAAYVGLAIMNNQAWPLVVLPLVLLGMTAIIMREERYLRGAFGDAYGAYCQRVRRWV